MHSHECGALAHPRFPRTRGGAGSGSLTTCGEGQGSCSDGGARLVTPAREDRLCRGLDAERFAVVRQGVPDVQVPVLPAMGSRKLLVGVRNPEAFQVGVKLAVAL